MKNSESGSSSQFPLRRCRRLLGKSRRRSLRLLGKPALNFKQCIQASIRKPRQRDDLVISSVSSVEKFSLISDPTSVPTSKIGARVTPTVRAAETRAPPPVRRASPAQPEIPATEVEPSIPPRSSTQPPTSSGIRIRYGSLRDEDEEEQVDITPLEGGSAEETEARKKNRPTLPDLVKDQQKMAKKAKTGGASSEFEPEADMSAEECATMEDKAISSALWKSIRTVHLFGREAARRLVKPVESEEDLRRQIRRLIEENVAKSVAIAGIESQFETLQREANVEVKKLQDALAATADDLTRTRNERQDQGKRLADMASDFEKMQQEHKAALADAAMARYERDTLRAELDQVPAQIEAAKATAIEAAKATAVLEYRKSSELDADLEIMMRMAMMGGYTLAANHASEVYPEFDVGKLAVPQFYEPESERLYDQCFEEFQRGDSLARKYGPSASAPASDPAATTSTADAANPTPDATS